MKDLKKRCIAELKLFYGIENPSNTGGKKRGQKYHYVNVTEKESSKTFAGVAKAMAQQWAGKLEV